MNVNPSIQLSTHQSYSNRLTFLPCNLMIAEARFSVTEAINNKRQTHGHSKRATTEMCTKTFIHETPNLFSAIYESNLYSTQRVYFRPEKPYGPRSYFIEDINVRSCTVISNDPNIVRKSLLIQALNSVLE